MCIRDSQLGLHPDQSAAALGRGAASRRARQELRPEARGFDFARFESHRRAFARHRGVPVRMASEPTCCHSDVAKARSGASGTRVGRNKPKGIAPGVRRRITHVMLLATPPFGSRCKALRLFHVLQGSLNRPLPEPPCRLPFLSPVSYTHLDVYKRQPDYAYKFWTYNSAIRDETLLQQAINLKFREAMLILKAGRQMPICSEAHETVIRSAF